MSIERIRNYIIENAQKEAEQIIKTAEEQFRNVTVSAKLFLGKEYQEMLLTDEKRLKEDMKRSLRKNRNLKTLCYEKEDDNHIGLVSATDHLYSKVTEARSLLIESANW